MTFPYSRSPAAVAALALCAAGWLRGQDTPSDDVQALLEAGRQHALAHAWDRALEALDRAAARSPDDPEVLRWRGHALTGAERYAEALADLERALALEDRDAWTRYARAMALHHLGRLRDAVDGYSAALELDPTFYKAYEWRGFTLSRLGDQVPALADIDRALTFDGANPWLRFIRAKAWIALLDFDRAETDLWLVLDADGTHADAHAQLGYLYACRNRADAAVRHLRRALALDPAGQREARPWLHHLLADLGDLAAADQQLAALAEPAQAGAPDWTGRIAAFLRGEIAAEGLVAAARNGAADPSAGLERSCQAWLHVGLRAGRQGDRDRALRALAHALATDARGTWEWSLALAAIGRWDGD